MSPPDVLDKVGELGPLPGDVLVLHDLAEEVAHVALERHRRVGGERAQVLDPLLLLPLALQCSGRQTIRGAP